MFTGDEHNHTKLQNVNLIYRFMSSALHRPRVQPPPLAKDQRVKSQEIDRIYPQRSWNFRETTQEKTLEFSVRGSGILAISFPSLGYFLQKNNETVCRGMGRE